MSLRSEHGTAQREEATESGRARQAHGGEREARRPERGAHPGGDCRQSEADDGEQSGPRREDVAGAEAQSDPRQGPQGGARIPRAEFPRVQRRGGPAAAFAVRPCGLLGRAGTREAAPCAAQPYPPHRRNVPRRKMVQKEVLPACLRRCGAGDRGDSCFCLALYLRHHRHLRGTGARHRGERA